jgi:hypothetical protein
VAKIALGLCSRGGSATTASGLRIATERESEREMEGAARFSLRRVRMRADRRAAATPVPRGPKISGPRRPPKGLRDRSTRLDTNECV